MTWHERKGFLILLFLPPIDFYFFQFNVEGNDSLFLFFLDGCHRESLESRSLGAAAAAQMEDIHWHRRKKEKKKKFRKKFFLNARPNGGWRVSLSRLQLPCVSRDTGCAAAAHRSWVCPPLRPSLLVPLDFWLNRAVLSSVTCSSSSMAKPNGTIVSLHVTSRSISSSSPSSNG